MLFGGLARFAACEDCSKTAGKRAMVPDAAARAASRDRCCKRSSSRLRAGITKLLEDAGVGNGMFGTVGTSVRGARPVGGQLCERKLQSAQVTCRHWPHRTPVCLLQCTQLAIVPVTMVVGNRGTDVVGCVP